MLLLCIGALIGHSWTESAHVERSRRLAEMQKRINVDLEALRAEREVNAMLRGPRPLSSNKVPGEHERRIVRYTWEVLVSNNEEED